MFKVHVYFVSTSIVLVRLRCTVHSKHRERAAFPADGLKWLATSFNVGLALRLLSRLVRSFSYEKYFLSVTHHCNGDCLAVHVVRYKVMTEQWRNLYHIYVQLIRYQPKWFVYPNENQKRYQKMT